MIINFKEIKKSPINFEVLLNILEILYKKINGISNKLILNELCKVETNLKNEYFIRLENKPLSNSDILIVSQDASVILTPSYINKIEDDVVYLNNKNIKKIDYVYVTYKF